MVKFTSSIVILVSALLGALATPIPSSHTNLPDGLIYMGATSTKEFYITFSNITGDFTQSLVMGCPLRFNMKLASVTSPEEVEVIDNYFLESRQNNVPAWTSAVARIGLIPGHWASTGLPINEYPANISGPWPSGAESAPAYASHNCVTIQRACDGEAGGCSPALTVFFYRICTVQQRYICEQPTM